MARRSRYMYVAGHEKEKEKRRRYGYHCVNYVMFVYMVYIEILFLEMFWRDCYTLLYKKKYFENNILCKSIKINKIYKSQFKVFDRNLENIC